MVKGNIPPLRPEVGNVFLKLKWFEEGLLLQFSNLSSINSIKSAALGSLQMIELGIELLKTNPAGDKLVLIKHPAR